MAPHLVLNVSGESATLRVATAATLAEPGSPAEVTFADGYVASLKEASEFDEPTLVAIVNATGDAMANHCTEAPLQCDDAAILQEVIQVTGIPPHLVGKAEDLIIEVGDVAKIDSFQMTFGSYDFLDQMAMTQSMIDFLSYDIYNQMVGCDVLGWLASLLTTEVEYLGPQEHTEYDGRGGSRTWARDDHTGEWHEVWGKDGVHFDEEKGEWVHHDRLDRKDGGGKVKGKGDGLIWMGPYWFSVPMATGSTFTPVEFLQIMVDTQMTAQLANYAESNPWFAPDDIAIVADQIVAHPYASFWAY